jgi:hypothetical protein
MSNFPYQLDSDTELPIVYNNITEIGGEAINAVREAVFNIEQEIGIGASGVAGSISQRLGVSFNSDGTLKPSAITSLGLVTLPITNSQIASNAGIPESKLSLDYRTGDLFNYINNAMISINSLAGSFSLSGSKLDPHLNGAIYRHLLNHIDINSSEYLTNKYKEYRDNSNSFNLLNDINNELLFHQFADGSTTSIKQIITYNGSAFPDKYSHPATSIFINTNRFSSIPHTVQDVQLLAQFLDEANIFLRNQNLYSNGISKTSRASCLTTDNFGQSVVDRTPIIAYLLNTNSSSSPVDDINNGDDIIEFKPSSSVTANHIFDTQFSSVKVGDIIHIDYGLIGGYSSAEVPFIIKEKKFIPGSPSKYIVRINGKNLFYTADGYARIDKPLFNTNKFGALAFAAANNDDISIPPSLIIGSPMGAMALGNGFNADLLDSTHYLLYLGLYPTGHPQDGYIIMPGIDVTGNAGATPGKYTLESVVETINNQFRKPGFNYRFIAFIYQGELGIMLADSYNNAGFSIFNCVITPSGTFDLTGTNTTFPNNAVGVYAAATFVAPDPLGFGTFNANIASPPYMSSYGSIAAAQNPTKLFIPLRRNNYYVNGAERDKLSLEPGQIEDGYGDGYWLASIVPGSRTEFPSLRVQLKYRINNVNLSYSGLKPGKTIVVQSLGEGGVVDCGRFIVENICFSCGSSYTDLTVYDSIHARGISPSSSSDSGLFAIYFNSDSVDFNNENASDYSSVSPFKRHFEVYIDQNGKTFTHERGRINIGSGITVNGVTLYSTSEASKLDIIKISPKLRGYQYGSVSKITLNLLSFDNSTGVFSGYLAAYDNTNFSHMGPVITGKKGQVTRFYDETNIDFIDILFDISTSISSFSNNIIDFQLFSTLSLDGEVMLLGTCQHNTSANTINRVRDERQFGNISEKELTTSALNFISFPEMMLHENGVLRGFDLRQMVSPEINPNNNQIYLNGGLALVNGKFILINNETVSIPIVYEGTNISSVSNVTWALCINDKGEYQTIPLLDGSVSRIFYAYNPENNNVYNLESIFFSDILNYRKDLTILYIVETYITVSTTITIALTINDARKYINDVGSNLPLKYNAGNSQSNFKNPTAIFNWLKYNSTFNGSVIIKGASSGITISNSINLGGNGAIVVDGENDAILNFTNSVTIGSNVTFKNITLNFTGDLTIKESTNNLRFENCNITVYPANFTNNLFYLLNSNKIIFEDCTINISYPSSQHGGNVFNITNTTDFYFINTNLSVSFNILSGTYVPGDIFNISNSYGVIIRDSLFTGNFNRCIELDDSSDFLKITNCSITSTYNPLGDFSYSTSNLVNTGYGYIHCQISNSLDDVEIEGIVFNYNPTISSTDRFSFINIEFLTNTSSLKNLKITNCRFNHLNISSTIDDIRPAIAIINKSAVSSSVYPQPILQGAIIANNICNRSQSIIVTSQTSSGQMVYPALVAINCSIINNICGTIGYWVGNSSKYFNLSPTINSNNDKTTNLSIETNTCHYICSIDHLGKYFNVNAIVSGNTINTCAYPSGNVTIRDNSSNWIRTAITYEEDSSLKILDNNLCAYDPVYIDLFNGNISNGLAAIHVAANVFTGSDNSSACIISGNNINTGYWLQTSYTLTTFKYQYYYIICNSSCTITNNILKGIEGSSSSGITISGIRNIITNNQIYRNTESLNSYINFYYPHTPSWDGYGSYGIVVDNFFDSPYCNGTDETLILSPTPTDNSAKWIVERNINQTAYLMLPITNAQLYGYDPLGSGLKYFSGTSGTFISNVVDKLTDTTVRSKHKSPILWLFSTDTPAPLYVGWQENLDKYLPNNVRVLKLQMGIRRFVSTVDVSTYDSNIFMYLNKYQTNDLSNTLNYTNLDYFTSTPNYSDTPPFTGKEDTKIINDTTSGPISTLTGAQINATSTSQTAYLSIDTTNVGGSDISGQFVTGKNYSFSISLDAHLKRSSGVNLSMYFSPLIIKYRW